MAEDRVRQSMLLDFYGELLTEKQRECCELHFSEDLSLAEIAEQCGVSRQGVWDNIRRALASMESVEERTGLIRRFDETRRVLGELEPKARRLLALCAGGEGEELARELLDGISALRVKG